MVIAGQAQRTGHVRAVVLHGRFLVVFCILLRAPGADRVALADPLPIEIGPISPADSPLCFNFGCTRIFTVNASDPELGCENDNDVVVEWNLDGQGWETGTPVSGQGLFTKTYTSLTPGKHTLRARAKEIPVPPPECDEETGEPVQPAEDLDFCLFDLLRALAGGQQSGTVVNFRESILISAHVTANCAGALLRYDIKLDGEDYEVKYEPPSGFDYVPVEGEEYTVTVSAIDTCGGCADKEASFTVPCSCDCCGEPQGGPIPGEPPLEDVCGKKLIFSMSGEYGGFRYGDVSSNEPVHCLVFTGWDCPGGACPCNDGKGKLGLEASAGAFADECGKMVYIHILEKEVYFLDGTQTGPKEETGLYKETHFYVCKDGDDRKTHVCYPPEEIALKDWCGECE